VLDEISVGLRIIVLIVPAKALEFLDEFVGEFDEFVCFGFEGVGARESRCPDFRWGQLDMMRLSAW
jgi:hypothetical protein